MSKPWPPPPDAAWIYRGAGNDGLRAFASATAFTKDIGTGTVVDVALADLNDDDRNEFIALTSEDELEIWVGNGTRQTGYSAASSTEIPATHGMAATGHSQMVIADLNCDDLPDVAMPADDGVVIRRSDASLLDASQQEIDGVLVREIAIGDFDDNGSPDIVAATDEGDLRVVLNGTGQSCGVFGVEETYPLAGAPFSPNGFNVAVGEVCPGHAGDAAIVAAWGGDVKALCGDGSGSFDNVLEPHGEEEFGFDYVWSLADSNDKIRDVAVFPGHAEVFALANAEDAGENIFMLVPGTCGLRADNPTAGENPFLSRARIRPLSQPFDPGPPGGYSRLVLQPETTSSATWRRALVAGNQGFYVLQ
jgi:hypothetical protein